MAAGEAAPIVSGPLTAASATAATFTFPVNAANITVFNRTGAGEVWFVVGTGSLPAPTVNGSNQWYLFASLSQVSVALTQLWQQNEEPEQPLVLQAISNAAMSLWIEVNE